MRNYIAHNLSGVILRTGICPDDMLELQAGVNETVIEGIAKDDIHYIDITTGAIKELPPKPVGDCQFDIITKSWVATQYTDAELRAAASAQRSQLLTQSDWTQLPDVPLATKTAWAEYRQGLRDITAQAGYPREIAWPAPPA